jgi:hypothetical protein
MARRRRAAGYVLTVVEPSHGRGRGGRDVRWRMSSKLVGITIR